MTGKYKDWRPSWAPTLSSQGVNEADFGELNRFPLIGSKWPSSPAPESKLDVAPSDVHRSRNKAANWTGVTEWLRCPFEWLALVTPEGPAGYFEGLEGAGAWRLLLLQGLDGGGGAGRWQTDRQTDRHRDRQTERVVPFFSSERFGHDVSWLHKDSQLLLLLFMRACVCVSRPERPSLSHSLWETAAVAKVVIFFFF